MYRCCSRRFHELSKVIKINDTYNELQLYIEQYYEMYRYCTRKFFVYSVVHTCRHTKPILDLCDNHVGDVDRVTAVCCFYYFQVVATRDQNDYYREGCIHYTLHVPGAEVHHTHRIYGRSRYYHMSQDWSITNMTLSAWVPWRPRLSHSCIYGEWSRDPLDLWHLYLVLGRIVCVGYVPYQHSDLSKMTNFNPCSYYGRRVTYGHHVHPVPLHTFMV